MKFTLTVFIAGVIAGLLIAPDKGVTTRQKLSNFLDQFRGSGEEEEDSDYPTSAAANSFPTGQENRSARNEQAW